MLLTIAQDSTRAGAARSAEAEKIGVQVLMVLAMRYLTEEREVITHYRTVAAASSLPIIVYSNPLAYGIDIKGAMLKEMADEPKFVAIRESTGEKRRVNEIIKGIGDRY